MCAFVFALFTALSSLAYASDIPLGYSPEVLQEISVPNIPLRDTDSIPLYDWKLVQAQNDIRVWETKVPVQLHTLFYHRPPNGMKLSAQSNPDEEIPYLAENLSSFEQLGWTLSKNSIRLTQNKKQGKPQDSAFFLTYQLAVTKENNLRSINTKTDIFRNMIYKEETRHGIYVPAPTKLRFSVTIPHNGVFSTKAILLPPEVRFPEEISDGADVEIRLEKEGRILFSKQFPFEKHQYEDIRIDLSSFTGQTVDFVIESFPRKTYHLDYVFLADPIIYTPKKNPKRIIVLFIDTLRQDAMSLYGYSKPTSPKLDDWAQNATIYTNAYSVSPWTLPATKTMLTGMQPEKWKEATTIQKVFSQNGWSTAFFAGNVYLSAPFELAKNWGRHFCENWPLASLQIQRAESFLDEYPDRDSFVLLHFMDMHLPYTEPLEYRELFAPPRPATLAQDQFTRKQLLSRLPLSPDEIKEYVRGRYDNNLRYLDDELFAFLGNLGDDATIALVSDHGEEFWEHNGFEHGHTLYEELIRIPFIIKSPTLAKGTIQNTVSLLDLAPTLASIAHIDLPHTDGIALQTLEATNNRPIAFGRPLYGDDAWGSLQNGYKYTTRSGSEKLIYLPHDPKEYASVAKKMPQKHEEMKQILSDALERPVQEVFRLKLSQNFTQHDTNVLLTIPQGYTQLWTGDTTIGSRKIILTPLSSSELRITWPAKQRHCVEVFFTPNGEWIHPEMKLHLEWNQREYEAFPQPNLHTVLSLETPNQSILLERVVMPITTESPTLSYNEQVEAELKALGYQE